VEHKASDGSDDLARARDGLVQRLPPELAVLARLAFNYRWSWEPDGPALFRDVDPHRWQVCGENPVRLLEEVSGPALRRAAADRALRTRGEAAEAALCAELAAPAAPGPATPERPVAFLCAEYGLHASLPLYAGGLGVLAGDVLKEASDRAVPLVAVGLLYRQGSFHQRLDGSGWQHEFWVPVDPERLPAALVTAPSGEPLRVRVPVDESQLQAQIWRIDVGRVPLFLLDADLPENRRLDRWITGRLYVGDRPTRLGQYLLLGIGGIRALRALGFDPGIVHLNEGHAAFAALELAREGVAAGLAFEQALAAARARTVFTTHTPVAAGNDAFGAAEILEVARGFVQELGIEPERFLALGRVRPQDANEPFGLTPLALRTSRSANGVSRRHGRVARAMWAGLWPEHGVEAVPITHVTNGVHLPSWMAPAMRALLDRYLQPGWEQRASDPATWEPVDAIPDAELWAVRCALRAELVSFVGDRTVADRLARGESSRNYVEAAARTFDTGVLTVGFARRLATYKRLHLLSLDAPRALRLLEEPRPLQILIAGKAHPQDEEAKRVVQQLFPLRGAAPVGQRVAYLEDYDLATAPPLVRGCDVWVNLPRPPLEASGTSGMKAALNGGLHLSVLDGWWEEAYNGTNGWGIGGEPTLDTAAQDARDAAALYYLFEQEIVPAFYSRDADGVPHAWVQRIKASMRSIGPRFNTSRMLHDYASTVWPAS
jgi:starch phosphorylase